MTNTISRGGASRWLALRALACAGAVAAGIGCGDGPICQSEVMVVIQSPSGVIVEDSNLDMAGLQTDVRIRSTVGEGVEIVLELLDGSGAVLDTISAETDQDGDTTFEDVTVVDGTAGLRASVDAGECGSDEDEIDLAITAGEGCEATLRQTPLDNDYYAPLGVLNLSNDPDPDTADFQADVDVVTIAGAEVELFVLDAVGIESSAGTTTADATGEASLAVTLGQGRQSVRAVCRRGALAAASLTTTVLVDTEPPECTMTYPVPGTTITPAFDDNADLTDGVQLTLAATADGGDTAGEAVTFVVTIDGVETILAGTAVDVDGQTTAAATIDPARVPAIAEIEVSTQDHAGNGCAITEDYDVVYDGCDITVVSPTGVVTVDADGDPSNGVQVEVELQVDPACAGQTVTSECGLDDPSGTVAGDGSLTLEVDWCATSPCDVQQSCTFMVTSPDDIETSVGAVIRYDDLPPTVTLQVVDPSVSCPAQITDADDVDGDPSNGVQIRLRVVAPLATVRQLEQTDDTGLQVHDASAPGGEVTVTLQPGLTSFVGIASDANGNTAQTPPCGITLAEIVVTFSPPAADGVVGAGDGSVAGSNLTFDLCGTVSETGATVTVTVDGGAGIAATVTGTTWCVTLTLAESPPSYTIVATADAGGETGQATLILTVDLAAPDPITDLAVIADTRQSLEATWTAPSDGGAAAAGYLVKVATVELTEANFDTTGEVVSAGAPQAPGTPEVLTTAPHRTGADHWLGIATVDAAGNRSTAAIVGPVRPMFDATAAILPPIIDGNALFGVTMTRGRFNDDELYDVAIGAPGTTVGGVSGAGVVYVYFGTPTGIGSVPDVVIEGQFASAAFGLALTTVRWSSPNRDDLVIGEPYSFNVDGRVYLFEGGLFTPGTYASTDAELEIGVHATANYFTGGGLGFSLAGLDFDGDGTDDLAIGDVAGGSGNGGVAIVYGGTVSGATVNLSSTDASQMGGAVVHLINDPYPALFDIFGAYLFDLGPTASSSDVTDDLLISYADGANRVFVFRGSTTRPTTAGVHARGFAIGQDVEIQYVTADTTTEFGAAAASLADQNGDGAREIVIGALRDDGEGGIVFVIDGATVGTAGVATTATPGVVISTIDNEAGVSAFGSAIVNNATFLGADVDGDGLEDLLITGFRGALTGTVELFVWFGGSIPTGAVYSDTADLVISGPSTFTGWIPTTGGTAHAAQWAGDVNGDGLIDISWGDGWGNSRDGSFQVLWDDGF